MTQVLDVAEAVLYVTDLDRATQFYTFRDPDNNSLELINATHYGRIWEQFWEGGS